MNKLLSCLAATMLLMGTACSSSDEPAKAIDGETTDVTFRLGVPSTINSRTISDGLSVDDLYWVVYNKDGQIVDNGSKIGAFTGAVTETTVSIKLVMGKTYQVAFWAQAKDASFYTYDPAAGTVTVSYTNAPANNELRDAFYKCVAPFIVTADYVPENVYLTRPFAQVNVGATDYATVKAHGGAVTNCGMTFTATPCTKLNLLTGAATDPEVVTFVKNGLPMNTGAETEPLDLNVTFENGSTLTASWLCMNYILVPETKELVATVTFVYDGDNGEETRVVNQVPVQRNYRTNILGDILTSEKDFRIIINPLFNERDYNFSFEKNGEY